MSSFSWPSAGGNQIAEYANLAAFPSAASAGSGALALALDTQNLYCSDGASWNQIGGPSFSGISLGSFGSSPNSNAASLSSGTLTLQPADGTHPGGLSTTTQMIAGAKTFSTSATSPAFISSTSTPATAGTVRMADTDTIDWRKHDNSGNIALGKDTADELTYGGSAVFTSAGVLNPAAFPSLSGDVGNSGTVVTNNPTQNNITQIPNLVTTGTITSGTWSAGTVTSGEFQSSSSNPASAGIVRLANAEFIKWRNAANSANVSITFDSSNIFQIAGNASVGANSVIGGSFNSNSANPASAGSVRLANNTDAVSWRNAANSADLALTADGSNQLNYNSHGIVSSAGALLAGAMPALTGDVTTAGGALATTAAATQNNITSIPNLVTVGTIGTGTWAGTAVAANHGGTGNTTNTAHGVLLGNGSSAINATAAGSSGQLLQSGGASADPAYTTATYPATASTANNILKADGTNWVSAAPITNSYFNGSLQLGSGNSWSTASSSFASLTVSGGSSTLTTRSSNVLSVSAAASNGAGVTFTPSSSTAVYHVSATFIGTNGSAATLAAKLTDGTVDVAVCPFQTAIGSTAFPVCVQGIYVPGTGSAVTLSIKGLTSAGTLALGHGSGTATGWDGIEWQIFQIKA